MITIKNRNKLSYPRHLPVNRGGTADATFVGRFPVFDIQNSTFLLLIIGDMMIETRWY
jgi:hypothetical protein